MRRLAQESTDLLLFYKICTADCRDAREWAELTRAAELHQAEETAGELSHSSFLCQCLLGQEHITSQLVTCGTTSMSANPYSTETVPEKNPHSKRGFLPT